VAKSVHDSVLDAALGIIDNATVMTACNAEPTTRTEAVTTFALADVTMAGGDYTIANGDTSGRKITIAQKTGIAVDTSGTANHIALADATNLLYVTTCTAQALTAGNTLTIGSWKIELSDPA
jgi:hypothetical protein